MKEFFSNVNGHLTHFSICYKTEIRSKWKKIDRIHILSWAKGKTKKLIYSVFLVKRMDELSSTQICAMNYLSLPIWLCRKQFSIFLHPEHIVEEGSQPSNLFYWLPPPFFKFCPTPTPFFFFCLSSSLVMWSSHMF